MTNPVSFKSMNYIGLTPILVQAIKEQEEVIDGLKIKIKMLRAEFEKLKIEIKNK